MSGTDTLTEEEKHILKHLKENTPVEENAVHMIYFATTKFSGLNPFQYKFDSEDVSRAYSPELHETIESLIQKGYIQRDSENLVISPTI